MHAAFEPPSSLAGSVSAYPLLERVREKVRKYRALAARYQVPLSVAVGAHRFTGVELRHLDEALAGAEAPIFNFQFGAGDSYVEKTVPWTPVEPWTMPDELAELLWINNARPFTIARRPNLGRTNGP
jgi:hypothetical protein